VNQRKQAEYTPADAVHGEIYVSPTAKAAPKPTFTAKLNPTAKPAPAVKASIPPPAPVAVAPPPPPVAYEPEPIPESIPEPPPPVPEEYAATEGYEEQPSSSEYPLLRALYEFVAETETDLSFHEGDIINLLDDTDPSGWWKGELNGVEGFFPSNFVERT